MEDFKARGKDVDELYMKMIAAKKKSGSKSTYVPPVIPKPEPKPPVIIPVDSVGKQVKIRHLELELLLQSKEPLLR